MADEKPDKKAQKTGGEKRAAKKPRRKKPRQSKSESPGQKSCEKSFQRESAGEKSGRQKSRQPKKPSRKKPKKPVAIVVRASSRYVRIAPRKARLIADQVRGLHIDQARALLQFSPRGAAHDIGKLIESAASNAENNHDLVADEMRVAEITVDEGPTLKRFRPRALGRATPIHKRTSHIAVALSPEED